MQYSYYTLRKWCFNVVVAEKTGPVNFLAIGGGGGGGGGGTLPPLPELSPPYEKLRKAHGILMIAAWALCAALGTFIARYLKSQLGGAWLYVLFLPFF